jgi:hypothetical protein
LVVCHRARRAATGRTCRGGTRVRPTPLRPRCYALKAIAAPIGWLQHTLAPRCTPPPDSMARHRAKSVAPDPRYRQGWSTARPGLCAGSWRCLVPRAHAGSHDRPSCCHEHPAYRSFVEVVADQAVRLHLGGAFAPPSGRPESATHPGAA